MGESSFRNHWLLTELPAFLLVLTKAFYWTFLDACIFFWPRAPKSVADQVILVTGASRGLGKQIALRFADLGAILVLWSSQQSGVNEVALEIVARGGRAHAYQCDVRDEAEVERVAQKVTKEVGPVDILVNNAGVVAMNPIADLTTKDIRRVFDINLLAHYWTIRQFLPQMMKKDRGHVVAVSSICSMANGPLASAYCGTKHGITALMDCVSQEAEVSNPGNKICFTTVCPGFFESGMVDNIRNRLGALFPLPSAETVAQDLVNAVLLEKSHVVTPWRVGVIIRLAQFLLSTRAQALLQTFIDYNVDVVAR